MNIHPASSWIEKHWDSLVEQYNNQWIGATATGIVGKGDTFDRALNSFQERQIPLSDVVFVFLTKEAIQ